MFEKIFQWFVYSSANPTKYALTVKSLLLGVLPVLMMVTGISGDEANTAVDALSNFVFLILSAVSAMGVIFGFARKVALSFRQ